MLTGPEILRQMDLGNIVIQGVDEHGFTSEVDRRFAGPNSFDIHLADELWMYDPDDRVPATAPASTKKKSVVRCIDALNVPGLIRVPKQEMEREVHFVDDPAMGKKRKPADRMVFVLKPGVLYLGRTYERIYAQGFVPELHGRSSLGRLGVFCHITAGFGDDGFDGTWTCELSCIEPVILYPYPHRLSRIMQVGFTPVVGERRPYDGRYQSQLWSTASKIAE